MGGAGEVGCGGVKGGALKGKEGKEGPEMRRRTDGRLRNVWTMRCKTKGRRMEGAERGGAAAGGGADGGGVFFLSFIPICTFHLRQMCFAY